MLKFAVSVNSVGYFQQQKLTASDIASNDSFGFSVAISSDGNTAIIGAQAEDTSPYSNNGAAYVFTRSGSVWTEQQKLTASDIASNALFGSSVAISSDGNTVIIGAQSQFEAPYTFNGAAYVFTRSGSTWTEQQKLLASDISTNGNFGRSVALSSDGNTAIVGADNITSISPYSDNSAAYVFTRSGSTWTEQQRLSSSDFVSGDSFGFSVALSADGNTALIGARYESTAPYTANGAAYVFTRSGTTWTEQQKLLPSDLANVQGFGWSVDLSSDGNTAIIGAPSSDTSPYTNNGLCYVFTRSGTTWTEQQKLTANDIASDDYFGWSVSISADGTTIVIGAYLEDSSPYSNNGAAYVFTQANLNWSQQQKLLAKDIASNDVFGESVAISSDGNNIVIGARGEDTSPYSNNGAAYIFVA